MNDFSSSFNILQGISWKTIGKRTRWKRSTNAHQSKLELQHRHWLSKYFVFVIITTYKLFLAFLKVYLACALIDFKHEIELSKRFRDCNYSCIANQPYPVMWTVWISRCAHFIHDLWFHIGKVRVVYFDGYQTTNIEANMMRNRYRFFQIRKIYLFVFKKNDYKKIVSALRVVPWRICNFYFVFKPMWNSTRILQDGLIFEALFVPSVNFLAAPAAAK